MNILVLNGSPRKNGNVAKALKKETEKIQMKYKNSQIIWKNLSDLNFDFCKGCMECRSKMNCILPADDAHKLAEEIKTCDILLTGTPVYWGNINGQLKALFDRLVYVLMKESKRGIPFPLHKGKKAVIVTSCTTPFPFNYLCSQSTGAVRAVKEILKSSGFKIIKTKNISNTKKARIKKMKRLTLLFILSLSLSMNFFYAYVNTDDRHDKNTGLTNDDIAITEDFYQLK